MMMAFLFLFGFLLTLGGIYILSGIHTYLRAQRLHAAKCKAIEELIAREKLARAHYHLRNPRAEVPRC